VDWFYLDALPELAFDHRKIIDKIKGWVYFLDFTFTIYPYFES
jgi:hypothetical protein